MEGGAAFGSLAAAAGRLGLLRTACSPDVAFML